MKVSDIDGRFHADNWVDFENAINEINERLCKLEKNEKV